MGKTVTISTPSKMDYSLPYRVAEEGSRFHTRHGDQGSRLQSLKNTNHKNAHRALEDRWENTGDLVSAVLDDTTTIEQQVSHGSTKLSAAPVGGRKAPKQPAAYTHGVVEPYNGGPAADAISRLNMAAFQANRAQAESSPGMSYHTRPSTSIQPKTTSRQRKGTIRHRNVSREGNITEPQHPDYRPAPIVMDRIDSQRATLLPPRTTPRQAARALDKNLMLHQPVLAGDVRKGQRNLKHQSVSILALTDATKLAPLDVTAVRRSKTTRESRKTTLTKQPSVLKKMTTALSERLHLTSHKTTEVEPHEADGARGTGFYDYETNRFVRDVAADIPTQKRQLPTRLAEIYEREEPRDDTQQIMDESFKWLADRKRSRSSSSKESCEDPFADPDSAKRSTTGFVQRLHATTPSKHGRTLTPATPSASLSDMDPLLRGSINSILPFAPLAASTPRITLNRRRSYGIDEPGKRLFVKRLSISAVDLSTDMDVDQAEPKQTFDEDSDKDMPSNGRNLAPVHGYSYQPVLDVANRKKHPSPNKADLELLEKRLRLKWPETLSQATEAAKKHPSPLKVDMQALGEQFRQAYPDLLGGNTPKHGKKSAGTPSTVKSEDKTDELALSFATTSTPEKRRSARNRKVSSVSCFSQVAAADAKSKRKTMAVSPYAGGGLLAPTSHMQLACPAYHQA